LLAAAANGGVIPLEPPMPDSAPEPMRQLLDGIEALGKSLDALVKRQAESGEVLAAPLPGEPLTDAELGLVLGVAASGGGHAIAATLVGRGLGEFRRMLESDAELGEQWAMAVAIRNESVERSLVRLATDGKNVAAAIFLSKQTKYLGFGDRSKLEAEHTHKHVFPQLVRGSMQPSIEAEARRQLALAPSPEPEAA